MERALAILGGAMFLAAASTSLLIVENKKQPLPQTDQVRSEETTSNASYEDLNDSHKLQRLQEVRDPDDQTLLQRAIAYQNPSYCERIQDKTRATACKERLNTSLESTKQSNTTDEANTESIPESDTNLLNRAIAYQDPDRCKQIQTAAIKKECLRRIQAQN